MNTSPFLNHVQPCKSAFVEEKEEFSNMTAIDPVSAVADAVGKIASSLPSMGIGSKSRQKEAEINAKANIDALKEQNKAIELSTQAQKDKMKVYLIAGVGLFAAIILIIVILRM